MISTSYLLCFECGCMCIEASESTSQCQRGMSSCGITTPASKRSVLTYDHGKSGILLLTKSLSGTDSFAWSASKESFRHAELQLLDPMLEKC